MIARIPVPPSPPIHTSGVGYYENDSREVSPYYENGHEYRHRHSDDVRYLANIIKDTIAELQ